MPLYLAKPEMRSVEAVRCNWAVPMCSTVTGVSITRSAVREAATVIWFRVPPSRLVVSVWACDFWNKKNREKKTALYLKCINGRFDFESQR